jgi:hypothetical protein
MAESYARGFGVALVVCDHFYFNYGTIFMEKLFRNRKLGSSNVWIFSGGAYRSECSCKTNSEFTQFSIKYHMARCIIVLSTDTSHGVRQLCGARAGMSCFKVGPPY